MLDSASAMFAPVLSYFEKRFIGSGAKPALMSLEMDRFFFARFANPQFFTLNRSAFPADFDSPAGKRLKSAMPFLTSAQLAGLQQEAEVYLAGAAMFPATQANPSKREQWRTSSITLLAWWKLQEGDLPTWAQFAKRVFLIQPSSASVERVFSVLNNIYTEDRYSSLEDVIELSCMYIYNERDE